MQTFRLKVFFQNQIKVVIKLTSFSMKMFLLFSNQIGFSGNFPVLLHGAVRCCCLIIFRHRQLIIGKANDIFFNRKDRCRKITKQLQTNIERSVDQEIEALA